MAHRRTSAPKSSSWWKRRGLEVVGWTLVILGVAALVLPGPGLLTLVAGLVLLASQYAWAKRLLQPIRKKALQLAMKSVQNWARIAMSVLGGLLLIALGVVWGVQPAAPSWWPIDQGWWLLGGWGTGSTLIVSGVAAIALVVYSFRRFRNPSSQDLQTAEQDPQP
jgi:uncharacterized protein (TIGR02611 family)